MLLLALMVGCNAQQIENPAGGGPAECAENADGAVDGHESPLKKYAGMAAELQAAP